MAEKLKNNLKEIHNQIYEINSGLNTSIDVIKAHYLTLRNEVSLEAEVAIEKIQNVRDEMIEEINKHETISVSNLETDKSLKQKSDALVNEMRTFYKEWSEYLKNYQINDAEMTKANKLASELESKFKDAKMNLEKLISKNKSLNFRKNKLGISKGFLGNFQDNKLETIDVYKFNVINLANILDDMDINYSYIDCDAFENGNIALVYDNESMRIAIIDKNRLLQNSVKTNFKREFYSKFCLKTLKESLVINLRERNDKKIYLTLFGSNLKLIKKKGVSCLYSSMDSNELNIYCLDKLKIMVFDLQLNNIQNIDQCNYLNLASFLNNSINQIFYRDSKFYYVYSNKIDVLNESTGSLLKTIPIGGRKMKLDSNSDLLVHSTSSTKIFKYNLNGSLQKEIELQNVPDGLELLSFEDDRIVFSNFPMLYFSNFD